MKMHDLEILFIGASTEEYNGMIVRTIRHHLNFLVYGAEDVILKVWEIDYVRTYRTSTPPEARSKKRRFGKFKVRIYDWESSVFCKEFQCTHIELSDGHILDIPLGLN